MYFEIMIDYTTGDSFNSERIEEEPLGIVNEDMDKAKENLDRIQAHWKKYGNKGYDEDAHDLKLIMDDGEERTINPFWMGYFENLHGAKIVVQEPEMWFET